jgi:polyisoprenoid-binding protein YceI
MSQCRFAGASTVEWIGIVPPSCSKIFARLSLLILGIVLAPALRAQQVALDFDPNHTQVEFALGGNFHTVRGTFAFKHGSIRLDPATRKAEGQIVVNAASGDSGSDGRDRRMNREILESDKFPEIVFTPDRFEGQIPASGDFQLNVHGVFRLHGADHEIVLPVRATRDSQSITATIQFAIPYVSWGLKNPSNFFLRVSDQVEITIHTVAHAASFASTVHQ